MQRDRLLRDSATWALSAALAVVFLLTGVSKLFGVHGFYLASASMSAFPEWIRIVVGLVEVGGALALLAPPASLAGAVTLALLMLPATAVQHMSGEGGSWVPPLVLLALLMVAWLRGAAALRALWRSLAPERTVREGILAGLIGATCVAVWFFLVDIVAGRPLFTPETLGSALFSVLGPLPRVGGAGLYLAAYTTFHYAAFIVVGLMAAGLVHLAGEEPSLLLGVAMLFVAVEIGFYAFVALLQHATPLGPLAWYQVLVGNVIAAAAMGRYLWRVHPALRDQFVHALDA